MINRVFFPLLAIALLTIYWMFTIKYNSRDKLKELHRIEKMITEEERKIKLLNVDLEHVSRPEAIRQMLYLLPNLKPIKPSQVVIIELVQ